MAGIRFPLHDEPVNYVDSAKYDAIEHNLQSISDSLASVQQLLEVDKVLVRRKQADVVEDEEHHVSKLADVLYALQRCGMVRIAITSNDKILVICKKKYEHQVTKVLDMFRIKYRNTDNISVFVSTATFAIVSAGIGAQLIKYRLDNLEQFHGSMGNYVFGVTLGIVAASGGFYSCLSHGYSPVLSAGISFYASRLVFKFITAPTQFPEARSNYLQDTLLSDLPYICVGAGAIGLIDSSHFRKFAWKAANVCISALATIAAAVAEENARRQGTPAIRLRRN